jgi:hypothetical protein
VTIGKILKHRNTAKLGGGTQEKERGIGKNKWKD